jgi:hypothetical protein
VFEELKKEKVRLAAAVRLRIAVALERVAGKARGGACSTVHDQQGQGQGVPHPSLSKVGPLFSINTNIDPTDLQYLRPQTIFDIGFRF